MSFEGVRWQESSGAALTCHEKLKVLAENLTELQAMAQDVFEEALILKVDEQQIRHVLAETIDQMENPYA